MRHGTITRSGRWARLVCALLGLAVCGVAQEPTMIDGTGWTAETVYTVGDTFGSYQPVGILDGIGAFPAGPSTARVLVNHELGAGVGYPYMLANGTSLTGARISSFLVRRQGCQTTILDAGPAYDTVYDRAGQLVTAASQINESGSALDGFSRFCSGAGVRGGTFGFVDDIFFAGEETSNGSEWALDVASGVIWAAPALGRGAWENVSPVATGYPGAVALILGDDTAGAPLYLYVGLKNALGDGSFLDRNGLAVGSLRVWVADSGDASPEDFNGAGTRAGTFVPVTVRDVAQAGNAGYDALGYADDSTLRTQALGLNAFRFSRPEDVHTNPADGTQIAFASTGRGSLFPSDNWGTVYVIDVDFVSPLVITATLTIVHDADALPVPDAGIRSPDNLVWSADGNVYVQEDRSTSPASLFGAATGIDASVWKLDPVTGERTRIGVVDRSVIRPVGATDSGAGDLGNWETSGIVDVTDLFDTAPGETLLLLDVQAHGIRDGIIGGNAGLVQGGQLCFFSSGGVMLRGDTTATKNGFRVQPAFTVGDVVGGYQAPGILDGLGAFPIGGDRAEVLVNHELGPNVGYAYGLANGTVLTGARISSLVIERDDCGARVLGAGPAYDTVYDRAGQVVTDPSQINETGSGVDGFSRFCSGFAVRAGTYGFVDDVFFAGEETSKPFHPHGGTEWALDVANRDLWAVPAVGRGAWENVTPIETGDPGTIGLLLGDDVQAAPLYLYIGQKSAVGDGSFLDRNGLAQGTVFVWSADNGDLTPQDFNGAGQVRTGAFLEVDVRDPALAGLMGYDDDGYLDGDTLRAAADALGAFSFSRPEDVNVNPADGSQAVFASTGRGGLFPADNWGTIYLVDLDFSGVGPTASLTILHDADGLAVPDQGIRSPDNVTWAQDGFIYAQEDASTSPGSLFGGATGIEASVWQLNPGTGAIRRIAEVDRSVVLPAGATDSGAGDLGNWETSGVIDVSDLFATNAEQTLLLATVQAHGIDDGIIGGNALLAEGGQIVFLEKQGLRHAIACRNTSGGVSVDFEVTNGTPGFQYFVALTALATGVAPHGGFFGIDISIAELLAELAPPLLGFLDSEGEAVFSFALLGETCPLGITVDCVAIEFGALGVPTQSSRAATVDF